MPNKKKLLYIASHLSTGGMPQYLVKQIECFIKDYDIEVIEAHNHSDVYVVQKNKIKSLCKLHTLGENKSDIINLIDIINPDIIHFTEVAEHFLDNKIVESIFTKKDRTYDIVCSTHGSLTNPNEIKYQPDRYVLVSEWSRRKFEHLDVDTKVWEYPIENFKYDKNSAKNELGFESDWKHVLNVGLFTSGKNQSEIFEIARRLEKYKIKFHFVGNQAMNFESYWKPLMETKPSNCVVWGERNDVDKFYKAADMFYFSSKLELNPLSVKEALSYGLPSIFRKLHTYLDTYDSNKLVTYINDDLHKTKNIILDTLNPDLFEIPGRFEYKNIYDKIIKELDNQSKIVEVGSWLGKSVNYLIDNSKDKKFDINCVDNFKGDSENRYQLSVVNSFGGDVFPEFVNNTSVAGNLDKLKIIKENNGYQYFDYNSLDFIMMNKVSNLDDWILRLKTNSKIGISKQALEIHSFLYNQIEKLDTSFLVRKPKIEIKHLMTKPNHSREVLSSTSLKQLERFGITYTPIVNEVYKGLPPADFCRRPHHIAYKPGDFGNGLGPITGPHYGCFMAHRGAIETMNDEYDYTLIFEADAFINTNVEEFAKVIYRACFLSERDNVYQISFGANNSHHKQNIDDYFVKTGNNQDLAHCYLVPNRTKKWWVDRFNDEPWDGWDIWMNICFANHPQLRYTTTKSYCKQADGFSLIDQLDKKWNQ